MANRKPTADRGRGSVHPGEILREDILPALDMTQGQFADALGVTRKTISALLNERQGLSVEMAVRLSKAFGTTPQMWINLQTNYDLARTQDVDVKPIKKVAA